MAFKIGRGVQRLPLPEVLTASVWELVTALVDLGALVSIGGSKDGGAVAVTVTCDGEWDREWFRQEEEVMEWLTEAVVVVGEMTSQPSSVERPRRGRSKAR